MSAHIKAIDKLAEENMRKWTLGDHVDERLRSGKVAEGIGPYILISREMGSGGSEIARQVGEELGWNVLDREILDYMAEKYGTSRDLLEFVDERGASFLKSLFTTWIEGQGFTETTHVHRLGQLFLLAGHHGKVVIVGRGAQFILPHDRGLSVRIVAPLEFRVRQVAADRNLPAGEAKTRVEQADRDQREFVRTCFRRDLTDPHVYDLVLNVENFTRPEATRLILAAAQVWLEKLQG